MIPQTIAGYPPMNTGAEHRRPRHTVNCADFLPNYRAA